MTTIGLRAAAIRHAQLRGYITAESAHRNCSTYPARLHAHTNAQARVYSRAQRRKPCPFGVSMRHPYPPLTSHHPTPPYTTSHPPLPPYMVFGSIPKLDTNTATFLQYDILVPLCKTLLNKTYAIILRYPLFSQQN